MFEGGSVVAGAVGDWGAAVVGLGTGVVVVGLPAGAVMQLLGIGAAVVGLQRIGTGAVQRVFEKKQGLLIEFNS